MKKLLSLVMVLAVMLGAVSVLSSCGTPEDDGAEISIYLGSGVYDLDPSDYYVSDNAAQLMSLIYEPLFRINEKGKLKCAAADDYEVDEDNRKITITLRETYWSDGNRVKAEDFVYAWRDVILSPNNANPAAALLYDIENAIEVKSGTASINSLGVVPRVYELEITYREGADYEQLLRNLASVATAPVRQDIVNLAEGHWSKSSETIVTNGPFMVKTLYYPMTETEQSYKESKNEDIDADYLLPGSLVLERNKGYHQSPTTKDYDDEVNPYLLKTEFAVGDKVISVNYDTLVNNTVFYLGDASLAERAANKDDAMVSDLASTYTYVFNTNNPLFNDKNVRYALSLALNRAKMVEAITFGKPASGLLPEFSCETLGERQSLLSAEANLTKARELIAAANLNDADMEFTLLVSADEESVAMANLAKAAWAELGFTVEIINDGLGVDVIESKIKDKVANAEIYVRDSALQYVIKSAVEESEYYFDVIGIDLQTYSDDGFVALSQFASAFNGNGADYTGDNNKPARKPSLSGWVSEEYDNYIKEAYETDDEDTRAEKLKAAEKLLIEEAPIIPVVFNQSFAFVSDELKKVEFDGFGNVVFTDAKLKNYQDYIEKEEE